MDAGEEAASAVLVEDCWQMGMEYSALVDSHIDGIDMDCSVECSFCSVAEPEVPVA